MTLKFSNSDVPNFSEDGRCSLSSPCYLLFSVQNHRLYLLSPLLWCIHECSPLPFSGPSVNLFRRFSSSTSSRYLQLATRNRPPLPRIAEEEEEVATEEHEVGKGVSCTKVGGRPRENQHLLTLYMMAAAPGPAAAIRACSVGDVPSRAPESLAGQRRRWCTLEQGGAIVDPATTSAGTCRGGRGGREQQTLPPALR